MNWLKRPVRKLFVVIIIIVIKRWLKLDFYVHMVLWHVYGSIEMIGIEWEWFRGSVRVKTQKKKWKSAYLCRSGSKLRRAGSNLRPGSGLGVTYAQSSRVYGLAYGQDQNLRFFWPFYLGNHWGLIYIVPMDKWELLGGVKGWLSLVEAWGNVRGDLT